MQTTIQDHLSVGSIVWALFGKTSKWPAIIISEEMTDERISMSPSHVLIFWLSSLDITKVNKAKVEPFSCNFQKCTKKMTSIMKVAVERALKILAERSKANVGDFEGIMDWARAEKGYLYLAETTPHIFLPNTASPVPKFVLDCLQHTYTQDTQRKDKLFTVCNKNRNNTEVVAYTGSDKKRQKVEHADIAQKRQKVKHADIAKKRQQGINSCITLTGLKMKHASTVPLEQKVVKHDISPKDQLMVGSIIATRGQKVVKDDIPLKNNLGNDSITVNKQNVLKSDNYKGHNVQKDSNELKRQKALDACNGNKGNKLLDASEGSNNTGCIEDNSDSGIEMAVEDVMNVVTKTYETHHDAFDIDVTMAIEEGCSHWKIKENLDRNLYDLSINDMERDLGGLNINDIDMGLKLCENEDDMLEMLAITRDSEDQEIEQLEDWLEEFSIDSIIQDTCHATDVEGTKKTFDEKHQKSEDFIDSSLDPQGEAQDTKDIQPKTYPRIESKIWKQSKDHLSVGSLVWALFGKTVRWPAIIISEDMTDEKIAQTPGMVLVFWLSSLDITKKLLYVIY